MKTEVKIILKEKYIGWYFLKKTSYTFFFSPGLSKYKKYIFFSSLIYRTLKKKISLVYN
jgi:hypothetical protein